MFIFVAYKDAPELSNLRRRSSEPDPSVEKTLLVNPKCHVRVMLEYIRKKCKLSAATNFDLCDEYGALKSLFSMPTFACAVEQFEHKKTYYLIVLKTDDKRLSVLPQINRENKIYPEVKSRVKKFLAVSETSPQTVTPSGKGTPPSKAAPQSAGKATPPKKK